MDKRLPAVMFFFLLIAAITLLFIFAGGRKVYDYVDMGGERITAEVARTPEEIQRGLMYRESLCPDCGMLFVFGKEGLYSFWTKNTLIPLDIIFIDANLTVIDIFHAAPCKSESCETYTPGKEALYVLEVNGSRFNETIIGQKVTIFFGSQYPS